MSIRRAIAATLTARWATPLRLGVALGVCVGLAVALRAVLAQQYLGHGLYRTAAAALALSMDRWVIAGIPARIPLHCASCSVYNAVWG